MKRGHYNSNIELRGSGNVDIGHMAADRILENSEIESVASEYELGEKPEEKRLENLLCVVNSIYSRPDITTSEIKRAIGKVRKIGYPVEKDYWKMKSGEVRNYFLSIVNNVRSEWREYNSQPQLF